jgi:beta-galactosidase
MQRNTEAAEKNKTGLCKANPKQENSMSRDRGKRIDRRKFLEATGAGVAGVTLMSQFSTVTLAAPALNSSQRIVFPLNHKWLYSEKNVPGGTRPQFNDVGFTRVTIPHTNKLLPWHGFDDNDYQFVSLYRRHFRMPAGLAGRRVFVDFGGVMTAATVTFNGQKLGEYRGGYTPFSFEITSHMNWRGDNVLAVEVDSTERNDIPPFGGDIDYLTFGGIYRDVAVRVVPAAFIENVFARPMNVLSDKRSVNVRCFLEGKAAGARKLTAELRDGSRVISTQSVNVTLGAPHHDITLSNLGAIELWGVDHPKLYQVRVSLFDAANLTDEYETRIGFREARFTPDGFFLNGKHLKLRGLNRHQTYPFVGQAMPARVQRRDAWILRRDFKCNTVRTSHYPQSPHFLDACDELGLLVFEEIPGWQHIGDQGWKELSVHYVEAMIKRDWNHPSIILWGVRVNESRDDHDFYTRTNQLAHALDDSRQTGGVRFRYDSEQLEDVFTMNDFQIPLRPPNRTLYFNTEFIGHMYPTKRNDNVERSSNTRCGTRAFTISSRLTSDTPAGLGGALSTTTRTRISVPAIASAITASRTSFAFRNRRRGFTNRNAIRRRRSSLNPPSIGRAAIAMRVSTWR